MDTMTRLASLTAEAAASLFPDAQGLPGAEELRGLLAVPPDPARGGPVLRLEPSGGRRSPPR